ncbi:uncharacterized protein BDR25DRAFT_205255, partial [Lindgomyces ingoldianus]
LEKAFVDTHQRSKARAELSQLKMKLSQDFRDFEAQFTQPANEAELPLDQWKDEIHDALSGPLPVHMEIYCHDPAISFFDYCHRARQIAFSLQKVAA